MSLVAITSAKGAPGVTSLALLLSAVPHDRQVVLVEADETGSSLIARFTLDRERGVSQLYRRPFNSASLLDESQSLTLAPNANEIRVVIGVASEGRRLQLAQFWSEFAVAARDDAETLYIVDCGRLAPESPVRCIIENADVTLFVSRSNVENVFHTEQLIGRLQSGAVLGNAGVVISGKSEHRLYDIARSFSISTVASLTEDAHVATVLEGQGYADRKFFDTSLMKQIGALHAYVMTQLEVAPRVAESA